MSYLTIQSALAAHERVADQFSGLLRSAREGTRTVPHLTWTVGETGAHVLGYLRFYPEMLAGTATGWDDLSAGGAENARHLAETPERKPDEIADAIDVAAPRFREAFAEYSEDLCTWHAGLRIPPAAMVGMLVGDMLVHGWDIAAALGRAWVIDPADACLSVSATMAVVSHFVDEDRAKGFTATYGIQLRRGPAFALAFAHGHLTATEGRPPRADCRISAEPVAYLLAAYSRGPVWWPVIRGSLLSYGRRPWLGLKLPGLLIRP